jgi:hypothetical protein
VFRLTNMYKGDRHQDRTGNELSKN